MRGIAALALWIGLAFISAGLCYASSGDHTEETQGPPSRRIESPKKHSSTSLNSEQLNRYINRLTSDLAQVDKFISLADSKVIIAFADDLPTLRNEAKRISGEIQRLMQVDPRKEDISKLDWQIALADNVEFLSRFMIALGQGLKNPALSKSIEPALTGNVLDANKLAEASWDRVGPVIQTSIQSVISGYKGNKQKRENNAVLYGSKNLITGANYAEEVEGASKTRKATANLVSLRNDLYENSNDVDFILMKAQKMTNSLREFHKRNPAFSESSFGIARAFN